MHADSGSEVGAPIDVSLEHVEGQGQHHRCLNPGLDIPESHTYWPEVQGFKIRLLCISPLWYQTSIGIGHDWVVMRLTKDAGCGRAWLGKDQSRSLISIRDV